MNLSAIYADGVSVVTSSPSYDPTQKQKNWVYTPPAGSDPNDLFVYRYAVVDPTIAPPYVKWLTGAVTYAQAAQANLPPVGFPGNEAPGAVPVPMDQAKIPAGYTLGAGLGAILQLIAAAPAAGSGSGSSDADNALLQQLQQVAADVAVIKAKVLSL